MAFGDRLASTAARGVGWYTGNSNAGNFVGNMFDAYGAQVNADDANELTAEQVANQRMLIQNQIALGNDRAGWEKGLREGIYGNISDQKATFEQVMASLGGRAIVDQGSIDQDYGNLRNQYREDVFTLMDRVNSQGYANNLARGMGDSAIEGDRKYATAQQFQPELQKADTQAYNDAIARAASLDQTVGANRQSILGEYDFVTNNPMKNALELYKNAGDANSSYYAGSMASANGLKTAATAQTGAQKALGNAYANINTQLPGQISSWLESQRPAPTYQQLFNNATANNAGMRSQGDFT